MGKSFKLFVDSLIKYRIWLYLLYANVVFRPDSHFVWWIYVTAIIISVSLVLIGFKNNIDKLRTFGDFIIIFVGVLFSSRHVESYILIMFPLIGSAIYRGKHYGYFDLILFTVVSLIANYYPEHFSGSLLIPIFAYLCISKIFEVKKRWQDLEIDLSIRLDKYFTHEDKIMPHTVLRSVRKGFNDFFTKYFLLKGSILKNIFVYIYEQNQYILISGTIFQWKRDLIDIDKITSSTNEKIFTINEGRERRIYTSVCIKDSIYLLEFDFDITFPAQIIFSWGLKRVISSISIKYVNILAIERRIIKYRNEKFSEIRDSIDYVNTAVDVMHYLRNRLSSVVNIITYDNLPTAQKTLSMDLYGKQAKQAKKDLEDIRVTADKLLDESHNPFKTDDSDAKVTLEKIFGVLSEFVLLYLGICVNVGDGDYPVDRYELKGSLMAYKLIFIDWLRNMQKYADTYTAVDFTIQENSLIIKFFNDAKGNNSKKNHINLAINAINSKKKDTVIRKNTHGIAIMKEYADGLALTMIAELVNDDTIKKDIICLTIIIPLYERN